ncbi:hypothetical protein Ddye_013205 [Dipteronia dyeriana]|uniref:Uncharacterized protein n=1 Tax=Dipteronia dyeriana TaxID=168575 RepID=A0AAE0CJE4_9ROSI|nr:hypothetical protein Ddye_013205 [Dipteronia dyeriana]
MVKEAAARKCSHCGHHGHNARICIALKNNFIIDVNMDPPVEDQQPIRWSIGMDNLQSNVVHADGGYHSNGQVLSRRKKAAHERKKGMCVAWTEDEHQSFLTGLKMLVKGNWKGISKNYVTTRTPTQVASHAQKYFIRRASIDKKNQRASVFYTPHEEESLPTSQDPFPVNTAANADGSDRPQNRFPHLCMDPIFPMAANPNIFPSYREVTYMYGPYCYGQSFPVTSNMQNLSYTQAMNMNYQRPASYGPYCYGQSFPVTSNMPTLSYTQAMNINYQMPAYVYMPGDIGNMSACANITPHPSGIPPPQSLSSGAFQSSNKNSTERDFLELTIGPLQSSLRTDLSSQAFGAVRVV